MKSKTSKKSAVLKLVSKKKAMLPKVYECPECALDRRLGSDIVVGIDLPESPWTVSCASCCTLGPAGLTPKSAVNKWNKYCEARYNQIPKLAVPISCPICGSDVCCIHPKGNKWQIACKNDCLKGSLAETPQLALEGWGIKK